MSQKPEFDPHPNGTAEELIKEVFAGRVADADPQMARLRLERRLRDSASQKSPALRSGFRLALQFSLTILALLVFGGWASNLALKPWDDAQQITMELPSNWSPADYPRLVGVMCRHSDLLYERGGHSMVVDYRRDASGRYFLQLGLLGVDYQTANDWLRGVLRSQVELGDRGYAITQPLIPYAITVGDMLAFRLAGHTTALESNVVAAWQQRNGGELATSSSGRLPSRNAYVYMITRDSDYARRTSMVEF